MTKTELKEKLAEIQHSQWSGWMEYLFSKGSMNMEGSFTIDKEHYERWKRQRLTPYSALSDREQESDRIEADIIMSLLSQYEKERAEELVKRINDLKLICLEDGENCKDYSDRNGLLDKAISLIRKEKE